MNLWSLMPPTRAGEIAQLSICWSYKHEGWSSILSTHIQAQSGSTHLNSQWGSHKPTNGTRSVHPDHSVCVCVWERQMSPKEQQLRLNSGLHTCTHVHMYTCTCPNLERNASINKADFQVYFDKFGRPREDMSHESVSVSFQKKISADQDSNLQCLKQDRGILRVIKFFSVIMVEMAYKAL